MMKNLKIKDPMKYICSWINSKLEEWNELKYNNIIYDSVIDGKSNKTFVNNVFNHSVLRDNAIYYQSTEDVTKLLNDIDNIVNKYKSDFTLDNLDIIRNEYSWEKLIDEHEKYFKWILEDAKKR